MKYFSRLLSKMYFQTYQFVIKQMKTNHFSKYAQLTQNLIRIR